MLLLSLVEWDEGRGMCPVGIALAFTPRGLMGGYMLLPVLALLPLSLVGKIKLWVVIKYVSQVNAQICEYVCEYADKWCVFE